MLSYLQFQYLSDDWLYLTIFTFYSQKDLLVSWHKRTAIPPNVHTSNITLLRLIIILSEQQPIQASDDNDGANPYCDKVADNYQGTCHDRYDTDEETGLATCNDGTHKADPQDCKDATNNRGGAGTREDDGEFVEED